MDYKNSRDVAWQMLIKHKVSALPVNLQRICRRERIKLVTYKEGAEAIKKLGLEEHTVGNDAFTLRRVIFFDDTTPITRQRFSVAHELGHVLLHEPPEATVYNREISPNDNPEEAEANIFASRLLAPLAVLHYLNVQSPEEIAEYCKISMVAARIRWERLCEIRLRDAEMRKHSWHGCFGMSPLEREVIRNFNDYIISHKK